MLGNEARRIVKQQTVLNLMSHVVAHLDNYHIKVTEHPDGILTISMRPLRRYRSDVTPEAPGDASIWPVRGGWVIRRKGQDPG